MKSFTRKFAAFVVLAATGLVGACAGADIPYRLPGERSAILPEDKGLVVFDSGPAGLTPARRVQYSDNQQRVDYALFEGRKKAGSGRAELVYMEIAYNTIWSFEFPFIIADKVNAWNFSKGKPVEWGEAVQLETKLGWIFYRPYKLIGQLTGDSRQCFGMSGEWDIAPGDNNHRPTRVMFGYYCAAPGVAVADEAMRSLAEGIGIRGVTVRATGHADRIYKFHGDVEAHFGGPGASAKAVETARGINGGIETASSAGIGEFPFRYARQFNPYGPDDIED
ncbi:MAG: hypothetical protein HQ512_12255 [Rhodospirillales bacterium]|nr:hypothetical protein [Rhodospirillales bacterium]